MTDRERPMFHPDFSDPRQFSDAILNDAQIGIIVIDRNLRYVAWNRTMEEISGLRADQVLGKEPFEIFPFLKSAGIDKLWRRALSGETVTSAPYTFEVPASGRKGWTSQTTAPFRNAAGEIIGLIISVTDVTELKQAEEALRESECRLRESEERLRTIVDAEPDAVFILDREGHVLEANRAAEEQIGYSRDELIGMHVTAFVAPHFRARAASRFPTLEGPWFYETAHVRKDGTEIPIELNSRPIVFDGKEAFLGIARDISERKRADSLLRQREALFRAVIEASRDAIIFCDAAGTILFRGQSNPEITGYTDEERIGRNLFDLTHPDDLAAVRASWQDVLERPDLTVHFEYRVLRRNGEWRRVEATVRNLLHNPDVGAAVWSFIDITDKRHAQDERERLEKQLALAQRMESLGRLAGGVAHDFNNLLTVINGHSQMALAKLPGHDPQRSGLEAIVKAGQSAAGLTKQLLAFSRQQVLAPRDVDMRLVLEEMRPMVSRLAGESVTVRWQLPKEVISVLADPHQIGQVLLNLVVNARDAMPSGGQLTIALRAQGNSALMMVSDTGTGMDETTRTRIFDPFFTTKETGTGLGLSTVHGIVTQSGGRIEVESATGLGTTFQIWLPLLDRPTEAEPGGAEATAKADRGRGTILLVEDQDAVREFVSEALNYLGYEVVQAATVAEAEQRFDARSSAIDLVISDIVMPGGGGLALGTRLEERKPGVKILYMSGYTDHARVAAMKNAAQSRHFLQKPFSPDELAAKVSEILAT